MNLKIVQKAIELAADKEIMKSYEDFYQGRGYFLTKNKSLGSAKGKPTSFPEKKGIRSFMQNKCHPAQKAYLAAKAGVDPNDIQEWDYSALWSAYETWEQGYYSVYFGPAARWACNLFVGETLFLAGHTIMMDQKYIQQDKSGMQKADSSC